MDPRLEFGGKRFIDHAMTRDPALPSERVGHDINPEMRLSTRPMPGMAFVLMGFIKHSQAKRSERVRELS